MRYKITPAIQHYIQQRIPAEHGSAAVICRQFGIKQPHLTAILRGTRQYVLDDLWNRLCAAFAGLIELEEVIPDSNSSAPIAHTAGHHSPAIAISGNVSTCADNLETFRRKVLDAIMQSDLTPDAKEKVYHLVREVK
jgi:hypothetical protein